MSNVPFRGGDVVEDESGYRYVIFEQSWSVLSIDRANRNPGPPLTLVGRAMPDAARCGNSEPHEAHDYYLKCPNLCGDTCNGVAPAQSDAVPRPEDLPR